jgi:hypothetical protein
MNEIGRRVRFAVIALVGLGVGAGCPGDSKMDDGGAMTGSLSAFAVGSAQVGLDAGSGGAPGTRYCQREQERRGTCGDQPFDEPSCQKRSACYEKHLRTEVKSFLAQCLAAIPCNSNDDDCFDQAGAMHAGGAAFKSFAAVCVTRVPLCMPGRDPADTAVFCGRNSASFSDADLADFQKCLEKPCEAVGPCLDQKWVELSDC